MNTGWKMPHLIEEDDRLGEVNKGSCYRFFNKSNITNEDRSSYARQGPDGTNDTHDSSILYVSNYDFNIPETATVTKVQIMITCCETVRDSGAELRTKTVKLKLGASTIDGGSGENMATLNQKTYKYLDFQDYEYTAKASEWGVELDPKIINAANFGCVFQVENPTKEWGRPAVSLVMMKLVYDVPVATITTTTTSDGEVSVNEVPATSTIKEEATFNVTFEQDDMKDKLDIFLKNRSLLTITYNQKKGSNGVFNSGFTPETKITSEDLRVNNRRETYSVPTALVGGGTEGETITQTVYIYPGTLIGEQTITIEYGTNTKTLTYTVKDTTTPGELVDDTPFSNPAQRIYIDTCTFNSNTSQGDAGAIYAEGNHFSIIESTGTNNTASSASQCHNIKLNGECKNFK